MDPCPFVRLIVESLALNLPSSAAATCYAKLKLHKFPSQTLPLPISAAADPPPSSSSSSTFHLDPDALRLFSKKPLTTLKISVFAGRAPRSCGVATGKLFGTLKLCVNLTNSRSRSCIYHSGWMKLGGVEEGEPAARLHLVVRSEPDPRFVFQFGGEPECSPVVFQIQENIRQPVFSCKFSADRSHRSRCVPSDLNKQQRGWGRTFCGGRERKGWMITVYDLSGSAVAAASMVTPFVPSPGSDRVCRSNPGAWLVLRPSGVSISSWKPWGRLEAWRESGGSLGYKLELMTKSGLATGIPIAQGSLSVRKGGSFCIDSLRKEANVGCFVMGSSVEGEGKTSKPVVQVSVQHVACAALFVALAAAVDLSMDACRLFSRKLRKEFTHDHQELM
ncbi:uncharacterized protein LOC130988540 [Salvia miltiorrhiza]|uniref:uncharacterized protein LOC130988540 n=1 Tax=Salvia miltiorrhiza TaxID=226208 RepID=UPI0025ABF6FF|nr:uncharacterized protein LOC130988540 [Salvia miltiorrhiza]